MSASAILEKIRAENIKFIDLRFTGPQGKCNHITMATEALDEDALAKGILFDASSISGWKAISNSDMAIVPDLETGFLDPFFTEPTFVFYCSVVDPISLSTYNRDPRSIARRCQAYMQEQGFADTAFVGPEAEFFVFDDVRFQSSPYNSFYYLDNDELPANNGRTYEMGNMGHRPRLKGAYDAMPPIDSAQDMRSEMLLMLKDMGITIEKHHHEVATAQHELGIKFASLLNQADNIQILKYGVQQVARSYGKTATFMPKPILGDIGSGMHIHLSLWKNGKPLFSGNEYSGLSKECIYFIGGILKHARALNAFTNPAVNSYKRLVPGFEAPVLCTYSASDRSASCRIPHVTSPKAKRVEMRFPDAAANPYLAFSAMILAGLDGMKNKIHPGEAMDKRGDMTVSELKAIPTLCKNLREALGALDQDRKFLTETGVFDDDTIDSYVALKMQEVKRYEMTPSPVEFDMYFSV